MVAGLSFFDFCKQQAFTSSTAYPIISNTVIIDYKITAISNGVECFLRSLKKCSKNSNFLFKYMAIVASFVINPTIPSLLFSTTINNIQL